MVYPRSIKEKAFLLFCENKGCWKIAKELKINKNTIYKWCKKLKWDERRANIAEKAKIKVDETIINRDSRQLKIIEASYSKYLEGLKAGTVIPTAGDVKRFMEHERLIAGLETEIKRVIEVKWKESKKSNSPISPSTSSRDSTTAPQETGQSSQGSDSESPQQA